MKQLFVFTGFCMLLLSCNSSDGKKQTAKPATDSAVAATMTKDTAATDMPAVNGFPATFTPGKSFNADKADLHESLKVQQLSKEKIAYEISMENGSCAGFKFQGVAILKTGDAESDSDENDNGFFVDEYVDDANGKCGVYIRIGVDKGYTNRARFHVTDCDSQRPCKDKPGSETLFSK